MSSEELTDVDTAQYTVSSKEAVMKAGQSTALPSILGSGSVSESSSLLAAAREEESAGKKVARVIFQNLRRGFRASINRRTCKFDREVTWTRPTAEQINTLCDEAIEDLKKESNLLTIDLMPCYILGDIHGNFSDLFHFLEMAGMIYGGEFLPAKFLFLGDYIDRGIHGLECVLLILCLKVLYPDKIYLLRGNHEWKEVSNGCDESLRSILNTRYPDDWESLYNTFFKVFSYLSIACIVDKKLFCVHGGLPRVFRTQPDLDILKAIRETPKPITGDDVPITCDYLLTDLLWADPSAHYNLTSPSIPEGFRTSKRGDTYISFEPKILDEFLAKYGFEMLIRAHECMERGCLLQNSRKLITVFSTSGYGGDGNSAGALIVYDNTVRILRLDIDLLSGRPMAYRR